MRFVLCAAVLGAVLAGCAQPQMPPLNFSVPDIGLSARPIDAEIRSLTVTIGRPDEQVGLVDWEYIDDTGGGAITAAWQNAMQEALDRTLIFRDGGEKKVSIAVKILKLEIPRGFLAISERSAETVARYEVIDRTNGDIIYTQEIASSGTVPIDYVNELIAGGHDSYQRDAREGVNRAVQNNISLFLRAAETIDVAKPMFPAGTT